MGQRDKVDALEETTLEIPGDDPQVEIDKETEAKLTEAGLLPKTPATETKTSEIPATEAASQEETPATEEPVVTQPEYVLIDGQKHPVDSVIKSLKDRQSEISRLQEERNRLTQDSAILQKLWQNPKGQEVLLALARGEVDTPAPQIPYPTHPDEFPDWVAKSPADNLGIFVDHRTRTLAEEQRNLRMMLGSVISYLENQQMEKSYGDLTPVSPYIEKLSAKFGQSISQLPSEMRILMAKGLQAMESAKTQTQQTEETKQLEQKKQEHRDKAIDAKVESATYAGSTGKVIDFDSFKTADEMKKAMIKHLGIKVADRG